MTLQEVLMMVAISSILILAITAFFGRGLASSRLQFEQVLTTEDARIQLERMSDALRNARDDGVNPWLISAGANDLKVYSNVDADEDNEEVRYFVESTDLKRGVKQPGATEEVVQIVARSVRNISQGQDLFLYYDIDGNVIDPLSATASNVRQIEFVLMVDVSDVQEPGIATIRTRITPREVVASAYQNSRLWPVTIDLPAGTPPTGTDATVTITDPASGIPISSETIPIIDLNDGRVTTYEGGWYTNINFQNGIVGTFLEDWYSWIGPILVGQDDTLQYFATDQISIGDLYTDTCLGADLDQLLTLCPDRTVSDSGFSVSFQPILTYTSSDGNEDYVRDIVIPTPDPISICSGLVGYWKFDDGSGATATDSAGTNDGTLTNGPVWSSTTAPTTYSNPWSLIFDGVDDYVSIADSVSLDLGTGDFTFAAWINPANLNKRQQIFTRVDAGQTTWIVALRVYSNNVLEMYINDIIAARSASAISQNTWTHVTATRSGTDVQLYIGGSADGSVGTSSANLDSDRGYFIGINDVPSLNNPFDGYIDDARIYNRALTPAEISTLASGGGECP